jgi:hypothetical protein
MLYARISGLPSMRSPSMMKCPFSKRRLRSRVVVKLNTVSFQWCTLNTRSVPIVAIA